MNDFFKNSILSETSNLNEVLKNAKKLSKKRKKRFSVSKNLKNDQKLIADIKGMNN